MANWENLGNVTAKNFGNANKDNFHTELFVCMVGNKVMYKTATNGYVIVPANMTHETVSHSTQYNARFLDHDGDEFYLNVPYWT